MKNRSLVILLSFICPGCHKTTTGGSTSYQYHKPAPVQNVTAQGIKPPANTRIYHDPDADFKQRRGQIHNRTYLKKELAPLNLNVDSLQDVVEILNRETRDNEWEYQLSTLRGSQGQILRFYKSHNNPDGSSGRTIYGEERRRLPDR
ncbi:hypothetical protein I5M27_12285 [Adhaeribacter sp. BT258]|uniref:Uncharacterized protein n=1 Tax=Adhaeribacter terrigena TaxID=2793070 RepID=A0ABS1C352_9BACT|nr:hypothetical protein [Adhaeribacter terrigena]MBK0403770.1 hypothetical protein [Adhaeribacter terrigena]